MQTCERWSHWLSPPQGISLHSVELEETSPRLLTRGLRLPAQTELANSHSWVLVFSLHPPPPTPSSYLHLFFKREDSPSKHWHDAHICLPIFKCVSVWEDTVHCPPSTCHGRWCDVQFLSTGQGNQGEAREDRRDSIGGWVVEELGESGECQGSCELSQSAPTWASTDPFSGSAEPNAFKSLNFFSFGCCHARKTHSLISAKYTHAWMLTHLPAELHLATAHFPHPPCFKRHAHTCLELHQLSYILAF